MAKQTFHRDCGFSNSMHRNGVCPKHEIPTVVQTDVEKQYSSLLLVSAALAEENDKLKVRLGKAMQYTIQALSEESRSKSLAYSRRALAAMKGIGES
jgi:hypothetical protein